MMTTLIIDLIKGFLIGWFLSDFQPIQDILLKYKNKISDKYILIFYLKTAVSCHKCLSFWMTLIMTGNIWIAFASGFLAYVWDFLKQKI